MVEPETAVLGDQIEFKNSGEVACLDTSHGLGAGGSIDPCTPENQASLSKEHPTTDFPTAMTNANDTMGGNARYNDQPEDNIQFRPPASGVGSSDALQLVQTKSQSVDRDKNKQRSSH